MKEPKLRFKDTNGDCYPEWKEYALDEIATCFAGATPSTKISEYWENGTIRWMSSGEVNKGQIYDTEKKISQLGFDKCSTKMVKPNTVVMALAGQGKTRGMVGITRVPLCTNQSLCAIETKTNIDDDYLYQYLQTQYKNLRLISSGDGTRGGLNLKLIGEYIVKVPNLLEQQKIASLFTKLDALIQSAEKELEGYRELKQGMLQKMFPKKGEKVPEIRFPEFTDDWEQCKLGDVTEFIRNGLNYKSDGDRNYRYKITRIESISTGKINIEKLGSSETINKSYKLREGDILFSHINSLPYIANTAIYNAKFGEIYHGMNLLNIRVNQAIVFPYFLIHLLKRETSRRYFKIVAKQAVNQASISITDVEMFGFLIPTLEEQKKIGEYFSNLDNLIALQQKELDGYKELKKGLLQQMFC